MRVKLLFVAAVVFGAVALIVVNFATAAEPMDCAANGDFNNDGSGLTAQDVVALSGFIKGCGERPAVPYSCDFNGDGVLSEADLTIYTNYFISGMSVFAPYGGYPVPCPCGTNLSPNPDTVQIFGLQHMSRGTACLNSSGGELTVSRLGFSGEDGVDIDIAGSQGMTIDLDTFPTTPGGAKLMWQVYGLGPGHQDSLAAGAMFTDSAGMTIYKAGFPAASSVTIDCYRGDTLVLHEPGHSSLAAAADTSFFKRVGIWFRDHFHTDFGKDSISLIFYPKKQVGIVGHPPGDSILVDRIMVSPVLPSITFDTVRTMRVVGWNVPSFTIQGEQLKALSHDHRAVGQSALRASDGVLSVSNVGSSFTDGVSIALPGTMAGADVHTVPMCLPEGTAVEWNICGSGPTVPYGMIARGTVLDSSDRAYITTQFAGVSSVTIDGYKGSVRVFHETGHTAPQIASYGGHLFHWIDISYHKDTIGISWHKNFLPDPPCPPPAYVRFAGHTDSLQCDSILVKSENQTLDFNSVKEFQVLAKNTPSFGLKSEVFQRPGCCVGTTGNVNMTGIVDLSDLSMLIAYLINSPRPTLPCPDEANVNATGIIDLSDLSLLIAYLTASPRPTLPNCP